MYPQDLNALDRAVASAGEASSGRGSSDECEDDEDIVSVIPSEDED